MSGLQESPTVQGNISKSDDWGKEDIGTELWEAPSGSHPRNAWSGRDRKEIPMVKVARPMLKLMGVLIFIIGIITGMLVVVLLTDVDQLPMNCEKDQVGVWQDYPDDIRCVGEDDHGHHVQP